MALTQEYFHLLNQYQQEYGTNTILLMQVGSFFEVYAKDLSANIQSFSKLCDLNVVENKTKIWMAGFKDIQLERYLKKIQEGGFTAVVYTCGHLFTRHLFFRFTPIVEFHHLYLGRSD